MKRDDLIKTLTTLKANDYNSNKTDVEALLPHMLKYIGDTEPQFRDRLIYSCLCTWIEVKRYFDKETLINLTHQLMTDDFIFYKIGNKEDDTVYTRSFSMLLINPILEVHLVDPFFTKEAILKIKTALLEYFKSENDTRAHDPLKGWAHSVSHFADSLYILLNCPELERSDYEEVLTVLRDKYLTFENTLTTDEDERMAVCIAYATIGEKKLPDDFICQWLKSFTALSEIKDWEQRFKVKTNIVHLFRSIYFMLLHEKNQGPIMQTLIDLDKSFSNYYE